MVQLCGYLYLKTTQIGLQRWCCTFQRNLYTCRNWEEAPLKRMQMSLWNTESDTQNNDDYSFCMRYLQSTSCFTNRTTQWLQPLLFSSMKLSTSIVIYIDILTRIIVVDLKRCAKKEGSTLPRLGLVWFYSLYNFTDKIISIEHITCCYRI